MFLSIGAPPILVHGKIHPAVWCVFMAPYFLLELKIYGQWLSGGKRRLSRVANPSSHLSVVGNFVGAILAAKVGWKEPAKFFWAIGLAHYLVLFVTLYQRLPTSEALPKELHPVYSMFIAAPSAASIAWQNIYGEFDEVSRTCYFIALFLYMLLVVRITFFTGFKYVTPTSLFLTKINKCCLQSLKNMTISNVNCNLQIFSSMVVLHFSHDNCIIGNNQVCRSGTMFYHKRPSVVAVFRVNHNGVRLVLFNPSTCICLAHTVSQ